MRSAPSSKASRRVTRQKLRRTLRRMPAQSTFVYHSVPSSCQTQVNHQNLFPRRSRKCNDFAKIAWKWTNFRSKIIISTHLHSVFVKHNYKNLRAANHPKSSKGRCPQRFARPR